MTAKDDPIAPAPGGTILFVDDEPLSLKYFKASVGRYAKVLTANSPKDALKILETEGPSISVVVSDERMPHDSGVSFLSSVRKSFPSTVRILTSAYANIENLQQAINGAAVHRFVPKPWDLDELCAAMQEALKAEQAAQALAAPLLGPMDRGDAENANLELLAILARELGEPLRSLDAEALQLALLGGSRPMGGATSLPPHMANWSAQLRLGQIAASAAQMQRDIEQCRSLAASIGELAATLRGAALDETASMAETVAAVLDSIEASHLEANRIAVEIDRDFLYRAPKHIIMFVLANLLRGTTPAAPDSGQSEISIRLIPGSDFNEVRVTSDLNLEVATSESTERANRCALWAFGGELVLVGDNTRGVSISSVRLPKP